ncbi:transcription-repair coupling factor (superfamily II helicase) [Sphingomonas gellani]|uniref:Transcription-repair-coupling factor n=1 Tax=Sphingomonas gellani TaxID=1166340 RepID=A0A1H7YLE3_9SPHN|nr:helicase-related protein [Sphingomonas gellani]SEM46763.1 transcription-repair coupling factor (superfamily II helicase) [Sphingomonas gellani]
MNKKTVAGTTAPREGEVASLGVAAARVADALAQGDAIIVALDEQRAEALTAALRAAAPEARVIHLPSSDALPGDSAQASPGNTGRRVAALRHLRRSHEDKGRPTLALVTTAEAAARRVLAPEAFDAIPPQLAVGDALDLGVFAKELEAIGYIADDRVDEPGEMAVRGQVADIFPADVLQPVRVEVADGRIASLRHYDPITQLGVETVERLEIGQVSEPDGKATATLFDHMPGAGVLLDPGAETRRNRFVALAADAAGAGRPREPVADAKAWDAALKGRQLTVLSDAGTEPVERFVERKAPARALAKAAGAVLDADGRMVLAGSERDVRFLARRVAKALKRETTSAGSWAEARDAAAGTVSTLVFPIDAGWQEDGLLVVAAADLIGSRATLGDAGPSAIDPLQGPAGEIRLGDVVVHEDFGLGVVQDIETVESEVGGGDAIVIGYAGDDRRLVPVAEADRIWRYGADADAVTLDKLDGSSWTKRRGAIDAAIAESARELTRLAAERADQEAPVIDPDAAAYERFAAGFPFTETADQARAIGAVRADLASGKPSDRLVIGDVGYGKTEVALRAAALAALAGKQVIVAAPTTVLVRQHLENFTKRFEGTGITVAGLSRLSSAAEKKATKAGLADGSIGVVVGTGAVAAKGVTYKDLALVVIDEEQRFGAADKAKLRALGDREDGEGGTHVLSLSATPIPRTLQTALVGLQQLSVIATPPARRQPIRTSTAAWDDATVRTALMREAGREGQSFVVVSRIEDMEGMADRLARLVPDLSVRQAHGKMPVEEIDEAMIRFANGDDDVLLATNIIEAGLDVPRANTMIVWRADRFGLSQLHQLRGRVGRGSRRGQVLLLTEPDKEIAPATAKRLRTLEAFDRLGAGFAISARDLDMRGAGDLIGETQAGHMKLIGVELYQFLLEAALRKARGEDVERWTPEINLGLEGRLPADWIPEAELRITTYARLARIADTVALDSLAEELEDRFGKPPAEAEALLGLARIRLRAAALEIARIDAGPAAIALTPRTGFSADPSLADLTEKGDRLILAERIEDAAERLERVRGVLETLDDG